MMVMDDLHAPSGTIAITAVLGGNAVHDLGYYFVVYPVLLNSILLFLITIVFNRVCSKQYLQVTQLNTRPKDPTAIPKITIHSQDIQDVLDDQTQ